MFGVGFVLSVGDHTTFINKISKPNNKYLNNVQRKCKLIWWYLNSWLITQRYDVDDDKFYSWNFC